MSPMETALLEAERLPRFPERNLDHIPGSYGLPLFGQTFAFLRDYRALLNEQAARYGNVFRGSSFFQRGVTLLGPEANEFVLRDTEHVFSSRAAWSPLLDRLFPNGLMLRDFSDHKFHRRLLQQAFKKSALSAYLTGMQPRIEGELAEWPCQRQFRFFDAIKELLLGVGAETFLGLEMGAEAQRVNRAFVGEVDASLAVLRLPIPGTAWHRGMAGRRYLENFIGGLVERKRHGNDQDFFAELCRAAEEEGGLSDRDIVDHMIFLLFAAHDTTTSTLSSIIFTLAKHPRWQELLRQEFLGLGKDRLEHEDLERLRLTTLVFREALRMHPPLPTIPRRTIREVEFNGFLLPRNTLVSVAPLHTHYMPEYWSEPEKFDPERFAPARAEDKGHFFQWVPFGGGHHKCIGLNFAELQTKAFLFHFLRRYRVRVAEGYEMPYQLVPLAVPKDGLPVTIHPL